jgi:tetratricopeptide (TPR) repeat protein
MRPGIAAALAVSIAAGPVLRGEEPAPKPGAAPEEPEPRPDRKTFSTDDGNYRLSYPAEWKRVRTGELSAAGQLTISHLGNTILVTAAEGADDVEAVAAALPAEMKMRMDSSRVTGREERTVAGERAVMLRLEFAEAGIRGTTLVTLFTHQGLLYRVVGVRALGRAADFEAVYNGILGSFAFLAERTEWLERFEGKPARTALLGGLLSFELNRPRWEETTFDETQEYGLLERADFRILSGGGFVNIRARETADSADAELAALRQTLASKIPQSTSKPLACRLRGADHPGVEVAGTFQDIPRTIFATVLVEDGIAVQVWLECFTTRRAMMVRDWEQLLAGMRLQSRSKPETPPAYPVEREAGRRSSSDPALAAFLGKAARVVSYQRRHEVLAIAPDGSRVLVKSEEGCFLRGLREATRREALALDVPIAGSVAWSRDGRRIAFPSGGAVIVADLDPLAVTKVPVEGAEEVAFGPGEGELLVCVRPPLTLKNPSIHTNRLEVVRVADGGRRTLLDYPLSRFSNPVVSPDGKRIALSANRDYPRTAAQGGHLAVCAADGKDLRTLTRDPEEIASIAWSPDGSLLYVVRRLEAGKEGAVGQSGAASADCFRVDPGSGEAVNLTRSGRIGRVWCLGGELALEVDAWDVDESQRGVFVLAAEALAQATAGRPVPPVADGRARGRAVAEAVRAALGGTPVKDVVPTPELMEKVAAAFAAAAAPACGVTLDYSAASLDRLFHLVGALDLGAGRDPALVLGFGAYYGETLRRAAGAEWRIRPVPFGDAAPGADPAGNPLVDVVFPFSDPLAVSFDSESMGLRSSEEGLQKEEGRKILLVHPPAYAEEAVRDASGPDYAEARRRLDAGEVEAALEILKKELQRRPKNEALAREVITLCEVAGKPEAAKAVIREAVEGGNVVPELLIRHGDEKAAASPEAALPYYRKAAEGHWPPAEAFIKLGKAYEALGNRPVAESCWRRAHRTATAEQKKDLRAWMGMAAKAEEEEE